MFVISVRCRGSFVVKIREVAGLGFTSRLPSWRYKDTENSIYDLIINLNTLFRMIQFLDAHSMDGVTEDQLKKGTKYAQR